MTADPKLRTAACACGALHLTVRGEPRRVSLCHCGQCQRRTGAPFGVAAFFARADVEVEGESRTYRNVGDSGRWLDFHFCPICGSTVYWEMERRADALAVAVGAFADPGFPAPAQSVWNERRHDWVTLPEAWPAFPQNS